MSDKQPGPRRSIKPQEGWINPLTSRDCGQAQLGQGLLYEASYQNRPCLRLIYNPRDYELTGKATIIVRCIHCGVQSQGLGSFEDYPMVGTIEVGTRKLTLKMSTERILNHLKDDHQENLDDLDDVDFFNAILDCCDL